MSSSSNKVVSFSTSIWLLHHIRLFQLPLLSLILPFSLMLSLHLPQGLFNRASFNQENLWTLASMSMGEPFVAIEIESFLLLLLHLILCQSFKLSDRARSHDWEFVCGISRFPHELVVQFSVVPCRVQFK